MTSYKVIAIAKFLYYMTSYKEITIAKPEANIKKKY